MKKILLISFLIFCLTSCKKEEPAVELPEIVIPSVQEVVTGTQNPDELEVDLSIEEENEDMEIDKTNGD